MDNQDQKPNSRDLRSSLNDGVAKIDKHIRELRQEISTVVPPVKDFMVKHPVGTLSTVFGIGFVIGCFIAGSQNNDD